MKVGRSERKKEFVKKVENEVKKEIGNKVRKKEEIRE